MSMFISILELILELHSVPGISRELRMSVCFALFVNSLRPSDEYMRR